MGICDDITLDLALPEYGVQKGDIFETKSLFQNRLKFTIRSDGVLVEHHGHYEASTQPGGPESSSVPHMHWVPGGDRVIDYHGDLLLYRLSGEQIQEFVARFTHGRLEWVRPAEDYPKESLTLLGEQGAR